MGIVPDFDPGFNPRARGRARPVHLFLSEIRNRFQSTRPWEGATLTGIILPAMMLFQSTRPWEGATQLQIHHHLALICFNPRARGRARLVNISCIDCDCDGFNPRARGRARPVPGDTLYLYTGFNPRARGRARPRRWWSSPETSLFQSTRPWEGATRF